MAEKSLTTNLWRKYDLGRLKLEVFSVRDMIFNLTVKFKHFFI